ASWSPWLMLSRATSRPAATSCVAIPGLEVAGPRVHTIFARRLMAGAPSPVALWSMPVCRPRGSSELAGKAPRLDAGAHDMDSAADSPPATMSLLGLVRHMTDVERGWFRRRIAGEDIDFLYSSEADPDGEFDNVEG